MYVGTLQYFIYLPKSSYPSSFQHFFLTNSAATPPPLAPVKAYPTPRPSVFTVVLWPLREKVCIKEGL